MDKKRERKQIAKISVFITSIFVIFLSVTYAFINMTVFGTKRQVVTAGNLELQLLEDENSLTITNALPMYDDVGMIQDAFTFRLVNKTSTDTNYILKLVDITTGDKLDTDIVKYGLTKDGTSTIKYLSNLVNGQIDKGIINGNQTIEYSLRLWIDSEVEDNDMINGKSLSYRIDVEVNQDIETSYSGMIEQRGNDRHTSDKFYAYKDSITSAVFENQINVPAAISEDKKWDVSEKDDGSVFAYLEEDGQLDTGEVAYKLHIQAKGRVIANLNSGNLFFNFPNLTTIDGFKYFDISQVEHFGGYNGEDETSIFGHCPKLNLDLTYLDTSKVTNMSEIFASYNSSHPLDLSKLNTSNVTDMSHMFGNFRGKLLNLNLLDTSKVTTMSHMFYNCSLTSLDLSNFDTSKVTNMSSMFSDCDSLTSLNLDNFDTSNVTNMSMMFYGCSSLTSLNLDNFDTSKVTTMSYMFADCGSLTKLDLSKFVTSNVTNMYSMFGGLVVGCSSLTSLDLSNFDTSNVTHAGSMFDTVPNNCLITVKDDAMVSWVKEQNSELTNVVVKSA